MNKIYYPAIIGVSIFTIAFAAYSQIAPPRDAKNAPFWDRIDHPPADPLQPPRSYYKPVGKILGAPGAFLPIAKAGKTTIAAQTLDEASQFAEANNSQAIIIIHKGVVQLEHYFKDTDVTSEFSSHSFAKTLNALAVGAAIADGYIKSVDQPASTWLKEWNDEKRKDITIRQLLTMSGGFRNTPSMDPAGHYIQLHYTADIEDVVRDAPVAYPPGTSFAYDNDNPQALGLVIERATGKPYIEYVSSRIWQKIGAETAEVQMDREGGRATPYCCIWSKPRDWARLGQMMLDRGQWQKKTVVPASWIDEMQKPSAANPNFGFEVYLGAAWLNPLLNRSLEAQKTSLTTTSPPGLYYAIGAGSLQLAIIPADELVIMRIGKNAPGWRDQALPNLLHSALHPQEKTDWSWLYPWRLSLRQPDKPIVFDPLRTTYWPAEKVAGTQTVKPLPRQLNRCLNEQLIAPAIAEAERTGSYSFLVWRDGAIEIEHYWPGFDANTRTESASMHKSLLGLVVGQAIADKAITSLDAPVSRWLTEWKDDARGTITIRQMLQMATGLDPIKYDPTPGSATSVFQQGADVMAVPLAFKLADKPADMPNAKFNYISGIPQLLGLIVERATHKRYADYLSARLWKPLGAADAYVTLDHPGGTPRTSANFLAKPEDWLRLGLLFVDKGRIDNRSVVNANWIAAMAAPSPANANYGFQLWRGSPHNPKRGYNTATDSTVPAKEPFLADDMVYFDGAGAERVYASPKERLVIVRLGKSSFDWDDSMVPNIVTAAARACEGKK